MLKNLNVDELIKSNSPNKEKFLMNSNSQGSLLLLHLSDIHFREPYCLNLDSDQDHVIRSALLSDIKRMCEKIGNVDAIIVSGDIAFKGHSEEYEVARKWFNEVAKNAGCLKSSIFTVPGNHDVDRTIASARLVQGLRKQILSKESLPAKEKEYYDTILDKDSGSVLFQPIKNYNLFAASYECDINPINPYWKEQLSITPEWKICLHGLTTIFFSGPDNDVKEQLYLGGFQRAFAYEKGCLRIAIMHHPPDWLLDNDDVSDSINENCVLRLLGHKHRQRYMATDTGVTLSAGAVNPDRDNGGWEPGYNFVRLTMRKVNELYELEIETYQQVWQASPPRFVSKQDRGNSDKFIHRIQIFQDPLSIAENSMENKCDNNKTDNKGDKSRINTLEKSVTPTDRNLVFDFWELSPSQRRKIMQQLELLESEDDKLSEPERYKLGFNRARDRNLISKIEERVYSIINKENSDA